MSWKETILINMHHNCLQYGVNYGVLVRDGDYEHVINAIIISINVVQ